MTAAAGGGGRAFHFALLLNLPSLVLFSSVPSSSLVLAQIFPLGTGELPYVIFFLLISKGLHVLALQLIQDDKLTKKFYGGIFFLI